MQAQILIQALSLPILYNVHLLPATLELILHSIHSRTVQSLLLTPAASPARCLAACLNALPLLPLILVQTCPECNRKDLLFPFPPSLPWSLSDRKSTRLNSTH